MTAFPPEVRRVAVLGDIGGQLRVFERAMASLHVDPYGRLPADLAVVQVGDLVRVGGHGLDNAGCVEAAERYRESNPGRWVQLLGNHDMALIGGPRRQSWPEPSTEDTAVATALCRWWSERQVRLAVGLRTRELGQVLITHAGLTRGRWLSLGGPTEPDTAADSINTDVGRPIDEVIRGGILTGVATETADVTWAEVITELYAPWLVADDAPFTQVHGHAAPWNWTAGEWWPDATPAVRAATHVDRAVRRTTTRLGSRQDPPMAVGVDWMLGDQPVADVWPLLTLTID